MYERYAQEYSLPDDVVAFRRYRLVLQSCGWWARGMSKMLAHARTAMRDFPNSGKHTIEAADRAVRASTLGGADSTAAMLKPGDQSSGNASQPSVRRGAACYCAVKAASFTQDDSRMVYSEKEGGSKASQLPSLHCLSGPPSRQTVGLFPFPCAVRLRSEQPSSFVDTWARFFSASRTTLKYVSDVFALSSWNISM